MDIDMDMSMAMIAASGNENKPWLNSSRGQPRSLFIFSFSLFPLLVLCFQLSSCMHATIAAANKTWHRPRQIREEDREGR